jgi:hypothetical protein
VGVAAGGDAVNGIRDICEIGFYFFPDFREDFRAVGVEKRPQFGHKIGDLRGFQYVRLAMLSMLTTPPDMFCGLA